MQNILFVLLQFLCVFPLLAQQAEPLSIHYLEGKKYQEIGNQSTSYYDSLNAFRLVSTASANKDVLSKRVVGYHPYWGGSNYLNYRWDLLTDLCYFSYEVDPATGFAVTVHDWNDDPAIDSALFHGIRVHLCVTLFSGHAQFFTNPDAWQNLASEVIDLVDSRDAGGVHLDIEALPSLYKEEMNAFLVFFSDEIKTVMPEAEVSIAAPAVNWSNKFDLPILEEYMDFFMVMAYDYYWSGSSTAGPVSPLYSMTSAYDYSFSRTTSYYQSQGVPSGKIIMGVPYYAYQWKTEGPTAPSPALNTGVAYTYRYVKDNNSGPYAPENLKAESNSFAPYFAFEQSDDWYQCFLDNTNSLGKKYNVVLRRNLGGIGIWALGYDNGYPELWNLIQSKFAGSTSMLSADTVYDSGGPSWDYYDNEKYTCLLKTPPGTNLYISFSYLDTEAGYDTLRIYDGPDVFSPLIGIYTGDLVPPLIHASENSVVLDFRSDASTVDAGWRAVYDTLPVSGLDPVKIPERLLLSPNPSKKECCIVIPNPENIKKGWLIVYDLKGNVRFRQALEKDESRVCISIFGWDAGVYHVVLEEISGFTGIGKLIVSP
jgi:hypothetical protein